METHIANAVDIAEEKSRYDTEVKNVLSDKTILAWIMSRTVTEFAGVPIEQIVHCIEGTPLVSEVYVAPTAKQTIRKLYKTCKI